MAQNTLSEALKQARKRVGMTLEEVGRGMGVSTAAASNVERRADRARVESVRRFVKALGGRALVVVTVFGKDESSSTHEGGL